MAEREADASAAGCRERGDEILFGTRDASWYGAAPRAARLEAPVAGE